MASRVLRAGGLYFNGYNYVNVPDSPSIRITGSVTATLWICISSMYGGGAAAIRKGTHPNRQYEILLDYFQDRFVAGFDGAWMYSPVGSLSPYIWRWIHLAYVRDKDAGRHKLLVNLSTMMSGSFTPGSEAPSDTYPLVIGRDLNGCADNVLVYNRALSADEIYEIYSKGTVIKDGLVLYLPFYEGEGNIAHDVSGYNNHGTIYGASWVVKKALRVLPRAR